MNVGRGFGGSQFWAPKVKAVAPLRSATALQNLAEIAHAFASSRCICSGCIETFLEDCCEAVGGPADEVGDLGVADFDDALDPVGALDDVDGVETVGEATGAIANDLGNFAGLRVGNSVEDEVAAFCFGKKVFDAADAEAVFDGAAELFHLCDEFVDLFGLRDAGAGRGL